MTTIQRMVNRASAGPKTATFTDYINTHGKILISMLEVINVGGTGTPTLTVTIDMVSEIGVNTAPLDIGNLLTHTAFVATGNEVKAVADGATATATVAITPIVKITYTITGTNPTFTFNHNLIFKD